MANLECVFLSRPSPNGAKESDFQIRECDVPACGVSEVLVQVRLFSCDPAMRTYMAGDANNLQKQEGILYYQYAANWQPGSPPVGSAVGDVIASRDAAFPVGAMVEGQLPWQKVSSVKARATGLRILDKAISPEEHISVLGGTGMAAYLPIVHIGQPKEGEVAFVSAAAGATGSTAAQCLRNLGCKVVGSAGSDEKVEMLNKLGIVAFNYNKESTLDALKRLCPNGVDIFFDGVGGETLEAVLEVMRDFGRIIVSGAISQYDLPAEKRYGIRNLFHITAKRITMRGFVTDPVSFSPDKFEEGRRTLAGWLKDGRLACECTVRDGFEQLPSALLGLLQGKNIGKMMVRVQQQDAVVVPPPPLPVCEFLFSLELKLTSPITALSKSPNGRALVGITGGSFTGPRLRGEVIGIGGDWAQIRDNGTTSIDVRATLQTHDGAYIMMYYGGRGSSTGDKRIVSQPLFETSDERYMWMNSVVGIGIGRGVTWDTAGKASYDVFRVVLPKL